MVVSWWTVVFLPSVSGACSMKHTVLPLITILEFKFPVYNAAISLNPIKCVNDYHGSFVSLCKKASNHYANLPLEMYSFTL